MEYPFVDPNEDTTGPGLQVRRALPAVHAAGVGTEAAEPQPSLEGAAAAEVTLPRLVIRGESTEEEHPESGESLEIVSNGKGFARVIAHPLPLPNGVATAALVDYLNCSFPFSDTEHSLSCFFGSLFHVLGSAFGPAIDRGRGLHGYRRSFTLGDTRAFFACGGNRGTGFLTFPGDACHRIPDWHALVAFLRDSLRARITRFDGAVDDLVGAHSVDEAVDLFRAGAFNVGGRSPQISQQGNWLAPDGTGRTFYVGRRKNGKMLRVYEKGMQLGSRWHPWVRWEVELHNVDRDIPWDAVLEPGKFVAGAYPKALGWVSEEQTRIRTLQRTASLGYAGLTHYLSVAYGKHIDVMLKVEGSAERVVERIRRAGFPSRLDLPPLPSHGKVLPPCEP